MAAGLQGGRHQGQLMPRAVSQEQQRAGLEFFGNQRIFKGIEMGKIFLVVPDAPIEDVAQLKSNRILGSAGIRLGVLDNTKGNADHLLNFIIEGIKKEFKVDSVVMTRKSASSRPATDAILNQLAREADLVVSAMAD